MDATKTSHTDPIKPTGEGKTPPEDPDKQARMENQEESEPQKEEKYFQQCKYR
jgi:hypothetical protein